MSDHTTGRSRHRTGQGWFVALALAAALSPNALADGPTITCADLD